jgi:hypothetical protein
MTQDIRQQIITLAKELPDESLSEALEFLHSLANNTEGDRTLDKKLDTEIKSRNPVSNPNEADFDEAMELYKQGSEKYKNALRELA